MVLEEDQVKVMAMLGSKYIEPFKDLVVHWNKNLGQISETTENWLKCQKSWM